MFRRSRKITAVLLALLMLLSALPAFAFSALEYNEHDVEKLRTFFQITNNLGIINGVTIMGNSFNIDEPSTWTCCTWNTAGRLTAIAFNDRGAVGNLDLSGCSALTRVSGYNCRLTGVDITGCSLLTHLEVDHNRISAVDVTGCPSLSVLWVASNKISVLDISNNTLLTRLSCSDNLLSELNTAVCPFLNYIDCGNNKLTELDVTHCTLLVELICKNNLLTELDISHCTTLTRLRALGNRIKHLDISVLNGGVPFTLDALGNGYVGTICNIDSSGAHHLTSAAAMEGSNFYGWYEGETLLTGETSYPCTFGAGEKHYTAHFDVSSYELKINYLFENGYTAMTQYVGTYEEGSPYSVVSPAVAGFYPDIEVVEGIMPDHDLELTVTYLPIPTPKHTLRIFYKYEDGSPASRTYNSVLEEGAEYSVPSPHIEGFYPDIDLISGVMGTEDITFEVVYHPVPVTHLLTIEYRYEDGSEALPAYTAEVEEDDYYSVASPEIAGFFPDIAVVAGMMGAEDMTFVVTYHPYRYTLTIEYVFADGGMAFEPYTAELTEGESYCVVSPELEEYDPDIPVVEGVMGAEARTFTVTYIRRTYPLVIEYRFDDGSEAHEAYCAELPSGESYCVVSPDIEGFIPDIAAVEGVMEIGGAAYVVTYFPIGRHMLTVTYLFEDGTEAWESFTAEFEEGAEYSVVSPEIDGFMPDIAVVEGVMGAEDIFVTVTYHAAGVHTLTVCYLFEDGAEAWESFTAELAEGAEYCVVSPEIEGYAPDIAVVEGVMGAEDVTIAVTYYPVVMRLLTVVYVFEDGSEAWETFTAEFEEGAEYCVVSPEIEGYAPDIAIVEGVMGAEDVTVTVVYSPVVTVLLGDVDGNGVINANDALMLLRYTLGIIPSTQQIQLAGDYDGNGVINANDALKLLRHALGIA